ncbi:MAG: flagellar hook-associated protein FlgK [Schwartzia sp.]|nr:flagellar hook-associated protein FlgK [Schwartzia sp. (in: firmicutes)]
MRSTFAGLNTMYRGVSTNRLALETTGHNMTNSNVEGYSRQSVNQAATRADEVYGNGTRQFVGSGVDSLSITRARDVYADKQYWREYADQEYAKTRQTNYQKLEAIFNDADDTGLQNALLQFYQSWVDMSKEASNTSERTAIIEQAGILVDRIHASTKQLQQQITSEYDDIKVNVTHVNTITDQIVKLNKAIMAAESTGGSANDLRDERDNLVDELSGYMSVTVSENKENSMYTVVSNGTSIVNGIAKLDLTVGPVYEDGRQPGIPNAKYGITDYNIEIGETGVIFDPLTGTLKAEMDAIKEDKDYIDDVVRMAAFLLTEFNAQHKLGAGMDVYEATVGLGTTDPPVVTSTKFPTTGINFFGDNDPKLYCEIAPSTHNSVAYIWDEESQTVGIYCQMIDTSFVVKDSGKDMYQWQVETQIYKDGTAKVMSKDLNGDPVELTGAWEYMEGVNIINALKVATTITDVDGERKIAARTLYATDEDPTTATKSHLEMLEMYMTPGTSNKYYVGEKGTRDNPGTINGTADGSNAVLISTLLNLENKDRTETASYKKLASIGAASLQSYYNKQMTALGVDSSQMNNKVKSQEDIVEQVMQWRTSVAGVNWDEELTNMIMFQQGYAACSRCLTTMDEMLDRLINSTGVVGR